MKTSRVQRIRSGLIRLAVLPAVVGAAVLMASPAGAQTLYTTSSTTSNWDSARWSTSQSGPFTSNWTPGSATSFDGSAYTFGRFASTTGGTTTIGNITVAANGSIGFNSTASQKLLTTSGGATIDVGTGGLVNFGTLQVGVGGLSTTGFTKNGAGTLALSGGAYTAGFTLNDGLVVAQGNQALGTGALTLTGGAIGASGNRTLTNSSMSITGDTQFGSMSGVAGNSTSANLTFSGSTGITLGGSGVRTFTLGNNGITTFNGIISGANGVKFTQASNSLTGYFAIAGSNPNTYGGNTTIDNTTVQLTNANGFSNGSVTLTGDDASQLKIASGLTLANAITIANSAGTKLISNYGSSATLNGGTITNNDTDLGDFIIAADSGKEFTINDVISGAGALQLGTGSLIGTVVLNGANSYSGDTEIFGGTVRLGNNDAIRNALTFSGANATLDLYGQTVTLDSVAGTNGTITSSASGATLAIGGDNSSTTLNTPIVDYNGDANFGVSLVKIGTGTLTLSGNNLQYSGLTTINGGTIDIQTTQEFLGGFTVNAGGTLKGGATIDGDLTVNGNGRVEAINGSNPASFSAANIVINDPSATTKLQVADATTYSNMNSLGNITYDGNLVIKFDNASTFADLAELNLFTFIGSTSGNFATITTEGTGPYSGLTFAYNATRGQWYTPAVGEQYLAFTPSTGSLVIVPEPSTWAMTLASVGFAGWMARRRKLARRKLQTA